jgi:hypothetical protein
MNKVVISLAGAALLVASLSGCNTCRRMSGGWFNRGDRANVCPPPDCPPGMPQATMMMPGTMMPGSPQVLPGPIEVAPTF